MQDRLVGRIDLLQLEVPQVIVPLHLDVRHRVELHVHVRVDHPDQMVARNRHLVHHRRPVVRVVDGGRERVLLRLLHHVQ